MQYLWNTGALSKRLTDAVAQETGLPLYIEDHPVPQKFGDERYDEGAAIIGGYIALCSERELTTQEVEIVKNYWIGKTKLRSSL